jgi:N-acetylglucosaminyldiphosphoundecaprenol N-acetyl-beta-D-mannosaminyltransferase
VTLSNGRPDLASISVGPFRVADAASQDVVNTLVTMTGPPRTAPATAFALHVGGLVSRRDREFVRAMEGADLVYADGSSVVLVAKAAGARHVQRAPTTDVGWDLLRALTALRGTAPTVSIVGGRPGLADEALNVLVKAGVARRGMTTHGYHRNWQEPLQTLSQHPTDVLLVGLGAPLEMVWVAEHVNELRAGLVLTCGGWLGFLAGHESRAPAIMQRLSLEWLFRLMQSPRRLASRYARGAGATAHLGLSAVLTRWTRRG